MRDVRSVNWPSMASLKAEVFGTEKDRVNCPVGRGFDSSPTHFFVVSFALYLRPHHRARTDNPVRLVFSLSSCSIHIHIHI